MQTEIKEVQEGKRTDGKLVWDLWPEGTQQQGILQPSTQKKKVAKAQHFPTPILATESVQVGLPIRPSPLSWE